YSYRFFLPLGFGSFRRCGESLLSLYFLRMTKFNDENSSDQNGQQQERDGDLEVTRDHLLAPKRSRFCSTADATAAAPRFAPWNSEETSRPRDRLPFPKQSPVPQCYSVAAGK